MLLTSIVIPVLTLVIIFLFGIVKFSKQVDQVAGEKLRHVLVRFTKTPLRGVALGAAFTAFIQSSTATTVILVALVDKGVISFTNSLGVILGANIGSTFTAQLVALDITNIAPYFVLLGFVVTYFGRSYKHWGKPIFYFGLLFFSLSLISLYLEPVKNDPEVLSFFASITGLYAAIAVGVLFTAIIQSSGVTMGFVVVLAAAGLMSLDQAVGIMLGANIGTTSTTLLASLPLGLGARRAAMAHFLFNVIGVLLLLPIVDWYISFIRTLGGSPEQMVVNAHVLFNVASVVLFLIFLRPFERLIDAVVSRRAY